MTEVLHARILLCLPLLRGLKVVSPYLFSGEPILCLGEPLLFDAGIPGSHTTYIFSALSSFLLLRRLPSCRWQRRWPCTYYYTRQSHSHIHSR